MTLPTCFDPLLYQEFRPDYPVELFEELRRRISLEAGRALDIGCGTGLSVSALLKFLPGFHADGVDRDPAMIEAARAAVSGVTFAVAPAEILPFPGGAFSLLLTGSAIHWFDAARFEPEARRVLEPGGFLFVFEYQFPRSSEASELNEWIRRRFNEAWKAPRQKPRGSLRELTEIFRLSGWKELPFTVPRMRRELSADELFGQILSQSRYLHSETGLSESARREKRAALREELAGRFGPRARIEFDFHLNAFLFQKSGPPSTSR